MDGVGVGQGEMGMDEEGGAAWIWGGIVAVGGVGEDEMGMDEDGGGWV